MKAKELKWAEVPDTYSIVLLDVNAGAVKAAMHVKGFRLDRRSLHNIAVVYLDN